MRALPSSEAPSKFIADCNQLDHCRERMESGETYLSPHARGFEANARTAARAATPALDVGWLLQHHVHATVLASASAPGDEGTVADLLCPRPDGRRLPCRFRRDASG
ncbi:hypothetical protein BRAS3843_520195 [Bradyrhizobium sp. STM 3843]|nr:hypothetical protein BRAS3843_520195 [Bradyrhizobium sp. STM 3843]